MQEFCGFDKVQLFMNFGNRMLLQGMNVKIFEFNRDWPFMNEHGMNENVCFDMSLETGYLEGYCHDPNP